VTNRSLLAPDNSRAIQTSQLVLDLFEARRYCSSLREPSRIEPTMFPIKREASTMTPEELAGALGAWSREGGAFPAIPHSHAITTAIEADAVCQALSSRFIYAACGSLNQPAFYHIATLFQTAEENEVADLLARKGLPLVRDIVRDAFDWPMPSDGDDRFARARREAVVFLLKILALYGEAGDGSLIVRAACHPWMSKELLWCVIFDVARERHPDAQAMWEMLRSPLPGADAGVAYLDICNRLAAEQQGWRHPFDSDDGIARIVSLLADRDPDNFVYATCAAACVAFVKPEARAELFDRADRHPDANVRLEAACALARTGTELGRQHLARFALDPRFASRAIERFEKLGLGEYVPARARDPEFRAMAEMCEWLASPMEFARPPEEIALYDTRVLNWPPTQDRRQLWLFKYRYLPQPDGNRVTDSIGMVGSITFSMSGVTDNLAPEDVYGVHCCFELELKNDPRAPAERSAAEGRKILDQSNSGFAG
jgi:hypothetical protein